MLLASQDCRKCASVLHSASRAVHLTIQYAAPSNVSGSSNLPIRGIMFAVARERNAGCANLGCKK